MTLSLACAARSACSAAAGVLAREEEAEIAVTLGQWSELAPGGIVTSRPTMPSTDMASSRPATSTSVPLAFDRDHHHAGGGGLTGEAVERHPERMAEDHLLEADAGAEAQGAGTESADRARGDLDDADAVAVDPQLRVDRPLGETDRRARVVRDRA